MINSFINLIFVVVGFILGRMTLGKGESNTNILPSVKMPNLNPINAYKEHKEKKEIEEMQNQLKKDLENIESYNGTSASQKD